MSVLSELHLIQNTGICAGNYKYFASKQDCDSWFLGKATQKFEKLSVIRPDPTSKNAFNVSAVHIPLPYSTLQECDYISFKASNYDRMFHAQVIEREYVNENSTRLYFALDYVASYFDTIKLGKCLVERTHVGDDFSADQTTASKYLLPEPIAVEIRHRPELLIADPFISINEELHFTNTKYNLCTTMSKDGDIDDPKIRFQSGGAMVGYTYTGSQSEIEDMLKVYVTYTSQMINRMDTILNYVNGIYLCPEAVTPETTQPQMDEDEVPFRQMFNHEALPAIRHAKVYDYFRVRVFSNIGDAILSPAEYQSTMRYRIYKTGGINGNYTMQILSDSDYQNQAPVYIQTATWASVAITATVNAKSFDTPSTQKVIAEQSHYWNEATGRYNPNYTPDASV